MLAPSAETHSMTVTNFKVPLRVLYFGYLPRGTKQFSGEDFLPPPYWHPFSSMLYIFSQGKSFSSRSFLRSSKWCLTTVRLKLWHHFRSRANGFPKQMSGWHLRKPLIHLLRGLDLPCVISHTPNPTSHPYHHLSPCYACHTSVGLALLPLSIIRFDIWTSTTMRCTDPIYDKLCNPFPVHITLNTAYSLTRYSLSSAFGNPLFLAMFLDLLTCD
jgi:hypothetical protein